MSYLSRCIINSQYYFNINNMLLFSDIIVVDGELCKKVDVGFRHTKLKNKFVVCDLKNTFDSKLPYYYKTKHKK